MKKRIKKAAAIAFSAALALPAIALAQYVPPQCEVVGLPCGTVEAIVKNFTNWLLGIFGFLGIIAFVIAGAMYLTAAGDETKVEKAKKMLVYGIIGIIVGLIGLIVQKTVFALLQP